MILATCGDGYFKLERVDNELVIWQGDRLLGSSDHVSFMLGVWTKLTDQLWSKTSCENTNQSQTSVPSSVSKLNVCVLTDAG